MEKIIVVNNSVMMTCMKEGRGVGRGGEMKRLG